MAFRYLIKPQDSMRKKILCISGGMVVVLVIIRSLYGACEGASHTGNWGAVPMNWLINIPRNFVTAAAGPVFHCRASGAAGCSRAAFPEGTVLA